MIENDLTVEELEVLFDMFPELFGEDCGNDIPE